MQGKRTNTLKVALTKLLKYGLSPLIFAVALIVGLVVVNYVIAVKAPSFDVTKNKTNSLSRQTLKLLEDINFNVNIKCFYATTRRRNITQLMEKYQKHNEHLKVEYIDPLKSPIVSEQYDVNYPRTIILESPGRQTRINPPTIQGKNHGEREITIALYRLLTDTSKTVYFSTGHGELNLNNTKFNGISTIKTRFEEQNYIVETINLRDAGSVPDDCALFIVPGPNIPFTEEEEIAIMKYLDRQGSLIIMQNPEVKSDLENIVASYGIVFGNDYIYETSRSMTTEQGGPLYPLCKAYDESEITAPLENQTFLFPFVRTVNPVVRREGINHINLIASSEDSWAETDMESAKRIRTGQRPSRDDKERKGPLSVLTIAERDFEMPDSLWTEENPTFKVRSAFVGNSGFISNQIVASSPSNISLFLNLVNWITRNEKIIDITPHQYVFTPVDLKISERRMLNWFTLVIYPGLLLVVGFVVWYRRR